MSLTCPSCGALLGDDATQCDLCGTPAGAAEPQAEDASGPVEAEDAAAPPAPAPTPDAGSAVFCNQCGSKNPAGSRFCSSCGARLEAGSVADTAAPAAPAKRPAGPPPGPKAAAAAPAPSGEEVAETTIGKRMGLIFGAAVLVVVAIFMIDAVSGDSESAVPAASPAVPAGPISTDMPLSDDVASQLAGIREEAAGLDGEARIAKLREAVDLLLSVNRFDRAAVEQKAIAEVTGTEDDWARTGNYYYDWMDQQFGPERVTFAKEAIAAYRKVLEINPDNLDVRTDMAVAYMSDPDNPMLAIQENAAVLEQDSLHVQANFNRGIMLLQINRVDQAVAQFRKVQRIVNDPGAPIYQLAEQAILSIEQGGLGTTN